MIELKNYGYTHFYESQTSDNNSLIPARIIAVHRELYKIISLHGESNAKLKGSVFYNEEGVENYPSIGDFVMIDYQINGSSIIHKILSRKSCFERSDAWTARGVQVVASNFDYVFIMVSLNQDFNINRIQRYLTISWQSGGIPIIILTKADLVENFQDQLQSVSKMAIGVDVVVVSAVTGFGIDRLSEYLKPTKTIVFLGSSGVGKSSLVNALAFEEIMTVNEIREDDSKGKHTTTHRQLIMLKSGVMIIDTPGMRELGMWDVSVGLGEMFSDIEELFLMCKFTNCSHTTEPNCAVLNALNCGTLEHSRWDNYLKIKREAKFTDDKSGYLRDKQQWHKNILKTNKQNKKKGSYKK